MATTLAPTSGRKAVSTDGAGSPSLSSSGGFPVVAPDRIVQLVRGLEQPFTVGTLVRAAEREHASISQALAWLRDAEKTGLVEDTGVRRGSATALRGARLYRFAR